MTSRLARRLLLLTLLLLPSPLAASSPPPTRAPTGLWLTPGRGAVVAISFCGAGLCGRFAGLFLDRPTDPMPVDYRGISQCHLLLITDARRVRPNLWKGHITDPRNGHVWGVELHLDPNGDLALRGFFGLPLLGHTQTWTRYPGTTPSDCRIGPPAAIAVARRPSPRGRTVP